MGEFEIRPDPTPDHRVACPWASNNRCCHFFSAVFHPILFILTCTGNADMHESLDEFEI